MESDALFEEIRDIKMLVREMLRELQELEKEPHQPFMGIVTPGQMDELCKEFNCTKERLEELGWHVKRDIHGVD